jgi:hypothetical protein
VNHSYDVLVSKSDSKAFGRLLCSRPKAKTLRVLILLAHAFSWSRMCLGINFEVYGLGQPHGKLESGSKKESGVIKSGIKKKNVESDNIDRTCFSWSHKCRGQPHRKLESGSKKESGVIKSKRQKGKNNLLVIILLARAFSCLGMCRGQPHGKN